MHRLIAGGTTDFEISTHPTWIIGLAPSGGRFQVHWDSRTQTYYVSRWAADAEVEKLGHFPDWEAAVACALQT